MIGGYFSPRKIDLCYLRIMMDFLRNVADFADEVCTELKNLKKLQQKNS